MTFRSKIDPRITQVKPEQIRAYMAAHGWKLKPFPRPEVWTFTKPKTYEKGHLTLVAGSSAEIEDYYWVLEDLIKALTVWEGSSYTEILSEMLGYPVPSEGEVNGANGEGKPDASKRGGKRPQRKAE